MKVRFQLVQGGAILSCLLVGHLYAQSAKDHTNLSPMLPVTSKGGKVRITTAQNPNLPNYSATGVPQANYQIAANDHLDIRVFREPDLSNIVRVGNDGMVNLPLIGQLHVAGLSVDQAAKAIQSRLAAGGFLPDPQVGVNISEFNHRRFTVLGQVTRSGTYEFPDEGSLDLLQAIGLAGGYTNIANPERVVIKRQLNGKTTVYEVNAKKLAAGKADYQVSVTPGDVITVSESLF